MATQNKAGKKQTPTVKDPQTESRGKQTASDIGTSACTAEERHRMICEEAFFIAEQRGFQGDAALDDWLRAEAKVDARLALGE
ncbi:MAG: DUF2934 domain-containing protein [Pseudomonadota bacterium]